MEALEQVIAEASQRLRGFPDESRGIAEAVMALLEDPKHERLMLLPRSPDDAEALLGGTTGSASRGALTALDRDHRSPRREQDAASPGEARNPGMARSVSGGAPPPSRAPEGHFNPLRRNDLQDPPLSVGASAPPPARYQRPGASLPGPDAGHPLHGAGRHHGDDEDQGAKAPGAGREWEPCWKPRQRTTFRLPERARTADRDATEVMD